MKGDTMGARSTRLGGAGACATKARRARDARSDGVGMRARARARAHKHARARARAFCLRREDGAGATSCSAHSPRFENPKRRKRRARQPPRPGRQLRRGPGVYFSAAGGAGGGGAREGGGRNRRTADTHLVYRSSQYALLPYCAMVRENNKKSTPKARRQRATLVCVRYSTVLMGYFFSLELYCFTCTTSTVY